MKTKIIITILSLLLLFACSANDNSTVEAETVKVGWIGPLTGTGAPYGTVEFNSAKLAVEDINKAGGINGKDLELIAEDGKCEGPTASTAANKLINVDKVKYLIGGHCSTESLAIVPITEENNVFLMAGATGTNQFTGAGKYAFRTFPPARTIYGVLAKFAYDKGTRKVVTFHEEKDWPQSVIESFTTTFEELGGEVLASETYRPGETDFRTQLLKLAEFEADAIMLSVQGPDSATAIIKQMDELGLDLQIYGDSLAVSTGVYDSTEGLLPETAIGGTPHINPDKSEKTRALLDRYIENFGKPTIDPFTVMEGYDGVLIVSELIKVCDNDIDCARSKLLETEWDAISGTLTFDENGDPKNEFVGITRIVDGKQVFEYEGE